MTSRIIIPAGPKLEAKGVKGVIEITLTGDNAEEEAGIWHAYFRNHGIPANLVIVTETIIEEPT